MNTRHENLRWILSYYRQSEIQGALFFGRLARSLKDPAIQADMTKHFADESQHAWYWTRCLHELDLEPIRLDGAYQDQYLEAAGLPVNLMEILAVTHVFEKRVVRQYTRHRRLPDLPAPVVQTIDRIMEDEKWHIQWVREALTRLEPEYGAQTVADTLTRLEAADREVFETTLHEHQDRLSDFQPVPTRRES